MAPEDVSERERPKKRLSKFERREVLSSTVAVTGAGDGLSQAMKVDPIELHHQETVYVVLECEVSKVRFDPVKDADGALQRVHVLKAGRATLVDKELVEAALNEQSRKIDEALGNLHLPFNEQAEQMMAAHDDGLHPDNNYEGCPSCIEAAALAAHEAKAAKS